MGKVTFVVGDRLMSFGLINCRQDKLISLSIPSPNKYTLKCSDAPIELRANFTDVAMKTPRFLRATRASGY